jgi:OOP family OmpA-OmpF porin
MHLTHRSRITLGRLLIVITFWSAALAADTIKVKGLIKARQGDNMVITTSTEPNLVVLLNDNTQVGQIQGVLKVRRKEMSMAALIPGLRVDVEGTYDEQHQLVATEVSFKGDDLKQAQSIQAGLHETQQQTEQHAEQLASQQTQISANKAATEAAVARFGQLDDYYIFDEVTVYFDNGKTDVAAKYVPQLLALTEKAKTINGYVIEVKGYASAVGSTELNQELSEDRADQVTNILIQQGHVPLTRMLAPGAMGESHQIGSNETEQEQAANRRVVVRLLQNKAIAGM